MHLHSAVTGAETAGGLLGTGHVSLLVYSVSPQCYLSTWADLSFATLWWLGYKNKYPKRTV